MNKSREFCQDNLQEWNCQCGEKRCVHTVGIDSPKGMTHVQLNKKQSRLFGYLPIFEAGQSDLQPNVLMSQKARKLLSQGRDRENTWDHRVPPQQAFYFIMDFPEIFLADTEESYENFRQLILLVTSQCRVTKIENRILQQQTSSDSDSLILTSMTKNKYKDAGIKIVQKGKKRDWSDARPVSNIIDIPEQLSQWERKYYSPELLKEVVTAL
tara:strand:+ start:1309 stop:1944 length:636 start_codon:yes stop_codon:yes gene_type:complete